MFRSIAIPGGTSTEYVIMVSVPRYVYYEIVPEREADEDDVGIETIVVEEEREVEVDVVVVRWFRNGIVSKFFFWISHHR